MPKTKNNHVKPTKEDLDAGIKEAIEMGDKIEGEESPEPVEPSLTAKEPTEEELKAIEVEEKANEDKLKKQIEDKDKKLSASARENQKIHAKNRVMTKALVDAEDVPEPTEEELQKEYTDWDVMSDTEKHLAKETVISRSWRKTISDAKEQATKIVKWEESVDNYIEDPVVLNDNPELEGKQKAFSEFAKEEANNSVPFKVLVGAFLHEHATNKPSNKGRMFEKGSGGPNTKQKTNDGSITLEESRVLRETNYNEWKKMLLAGKIKSDL